MGDAPLPVRLGERRTSDVVVRLRTEEGSREEWFYCHSLLLADKSRYFADRLSPRWPTCQILDSRTCVDVLCPELLLDFYVTTLRLLYSAPDAVLGALQNVRNALGILRVSADLGCQQLADSCLGFLEASPWEVAEEEEILRIVSGLGSQYKPILARLQPVDSDYIDGVFVSAMRFATSCPPACMHELKSSAQEQLEYMLTEDDDAPLLNSSSLFTAEVKKCTSNLTFQFDNFLESLRSCPANEALELDRLVILKSYLADLSWACQILAKIELMKNIVYFWVDASVKIIEIVEHLNASRSLMEIKLKVVELLAKILDAIGYGHVILPSIMRVQMVKVWLPFVQKTKALADSFCSVDGEDDAEDKIDGEMWQSLESVFVSIILALPSGDQAVILADWLKGKHVRYPDLSEAFEIWCYRHKVARRRMHLLDNAMTHPSDDRDG